MAKTRAKWTETRGAFRPIELFFFSAELVYSCALDSSSREILADQWKKRTGLEHVDETKQLNLNNLANIDFMEVVPVAELERFTLLLLASFFSVVLFIIQQLTILKL